MGRILADELVGLVDRRLRLAVLVVRVHQVQLALARRIAERKTRFELLVVGDRVPVVAVVAGVLGQLVELVRRCRPAGAGCCRSRPAPRAARSRGQDEDARARIRRHCIRSIPVGSGRQARRASIAGSFLCRQARPEVPPIPCPSPHVRTACPNRSSHAHHSRRIRRPAPGPGAGRAAVRLFPHPHQGMDRGRPGARRR